MSARSIFLFAAVFALLAGADGAAGGRIYKWTDEKGVTHYGESIPAEYRNQAATEMTERGLAVRKIESAAALEAQRRTAQEKALAERDEQKRLFEQRRRDMALVNTYTTLREIDDARERNLAGPIQALRALEPRMKRVQDELAALQRQAQNLGNSGKAVPEFVRQDIEEKKLELAEMMAEKERHESQIQAIRARYEADKKRYMELTQR
jgi:chromosome segregation ATPase